MANIAFFPISPDFWEGFKTLYDDLSSDICNQIAVIPVSCYKKDLNGNVFDYNRSDISYPSDVAITDYNSLDWNNIHFDIIYIQNAQDSTNLGFSVDSFFYVSNLQKYTRKIVYIPYQFMSEPNVNNTNQLKELRPLVITDSLYKIDRIIVQSENMKNAYVELLAGKDTKQKEIWNKKISWKDHPRRELLNRYTKETVPVPKSWSKILKKEDGTAKETILVCTSLFGLLTQNRSLIRETKAFFESYLDKTDKIAMIWRPYPAVFDVIDKMRPELVKDLNDLIAFFKENRLGVFDNTPTPSPAVILSDKYVGDPCGVMELFKCTGKPVLKVFHLL